MIGSGTVFFVAFEVIMMVSHVEFIVVTLSDTNVVAFCTSGKRRSGWSWSEGKIFCLIESQSRLKGNLGK